MSPSEVHKNMYNSYLIDQNQLESILNVKKTLFKKQIDDR